MRKRKALPRIKKVDMVLVWWKDAESDTGWLHPDDLDHDKQAMPAVGFIVKKTKERLYLGLSWDSDNGNFNPVLSIPLSWVLQLSVLGQLSMDPSSGRFELKRRQLGKRDLSFSI